MKKNRVLSTLLSLVIVLGLMPGMSLTTYADATPPEVTVTPEGAGTVTVEPYNDADSSPGWLCTATSAEDYTFLRLSSTDPSGVTQNAQGNPAIVPLDTSKVEAKFYKPSDGGYFIDVSKVNWWYDYDELETNAESLPYTTDLRTLLGRTVSAGLAGETYYITEASIFSGGDNCTLGEFSGDPGAVSYNADVTVNAPGSYEISMKYLYEGLVSYVSIRIDVTKNEVAVNDVTLVPTTATLTAGGDPVVLTATVKPDGRATDKTVKWSVGGTNAGAVTLYSDEACTAEIGTDATETLTVYAKGISAGNATVTATSNADSDKTASCEVTVNPVTYEATYQVVNGTWSDGSTTDKKETVVDGSKPASVPTGMKAASGYTGGAWDTDPASAAITGAKTFTYSFTAK